MSKKFKIAEESKIFSGKNKTSKNMSLLDSSHYNKLLLNVPKKKEKVAKKHS